LFTLFYNPPLNFTQWYDVARRARDRPGCQRQMFSFLEVQQIRCFFDTILMSYGLWLLNASFVTPAIFRSKLRHQCQSKIANKKPQLLLRAA
jgi:hypothetical protein